MNEPPKPWLMCSQAFFETRIYHDPEKPLPLWLRVAYAALARCGPNGHAEFEPNELCTLLLPAVSTTKAKRAQVSRAITKAVEHGYLSRGSTRCLVVSAWFGTALPGCNKPCPTCTGIASRPRRVPTKFVSFESTDKSLKASTQMRRSARRVLTVRVNPVSSNG